ncbi:hypothetical protein B0O99DRAFT_30463 [Bisporella sp. PMI_857]|nr:hypothetical protein B0O99DRAFT_30463 [Bisporella sp. PMI_857]
MAWEPPKILQVLGNVFNNRAEQPGLGGAAQQHLQNINTHQGNTWQERWLRSESKWNHRIGKNWKGKKVLGMGGQGVVGWWTYEGSDRDSKALVDIVVKQASATGPGGGLAGEAKLLDILRHTGSPHVLKMYKNLFQDEGEGVMPEFDTGLVHRILLEYCPGGDLIDFLRTRRRGGLSEEDLWGVFHCMARAIFVLEHGSEDPNKPKWNREIVHFDLKEENSILSPLLYYKEHFVMLTIGTSPNRTRRDRQ